MNLEQNRSKIKKNKLFILIGKSSTGKDTVYKKLLEYSELNLKEVVGYTTRPIRDGETDGVEYHFIKDKDNFFANNTKGHIIETRHYATEHGDWCYMTIDDGQFDFKTNHLMIGTLESYEKIRDYFGPENVYPIYIEVDDGIRLQRALNRERNQENPKYEEMCRRFLADAKDFSEYNLNRLGVKDRFVNNDINECTNQIANKIVLCTNSLK